MLKGFRDFIMRGNVIDLAVAVVIGAAFNSIVTAFTTSVIGPIVAVAGGTQVTGLAWQLVPGNEKSLLDLGALITATINFLIVAAVVYFVFVLPMNAFKERLAKGEETAPAATPEDVAVLREIRDLLAERKADGRP